MSKKQFYKISRWHAPVEDSNYTLEKLKSIKNFHGQQMIFSAEEEKNLYFQQLEQNWEMN